MSPTSCRCSTPRLIRLPVIRVLVKRIRYKLSATSTATRRDKQAKATQLVLEQAEVLSELWAPRNSCGRHVLQEPTNRDNRSLRIAGSLDQCLPRGSPIARPPRPSTEKWIWPLTRSGSDLTQKWI